MSDKIRPLGEDLIKGEERTIRFTFTDASGSAVNMSGSTFALSLRKTISTAPVFTIPDASFDTSNIANGIVKATVSAAQNTRPGDWFFLLWTTFATGDIVGQYYSVTYVDKGS